MRINLVYEINNREYINCILLERELLRRGFDVNICCKTEDYVSSDEVSWTIIPNSYNSDNVNHYRYTFNTKNNIIIYPCEQVVNHRLPRYFDYSDNNTVKHLPNLCWGNDYYNFIESLGYDMSQSHIVGAIQLDFCRPEFRSFFKDRQTISREYGLPMEKKWILFISDFVYASDAMRDFLIKKGGEDEDVVIKRHIHELETCDILLEWFDSFIKRHNDYLIIYRKHPVEEFITPILNMAKKYPDNFFPISELNIKEWIVNSDVITTWNSTAGIECYAANKDILLLRPVEFHPDLGRSEYSFYLNYPKIKTFKDFEYMVCSYDKNDLRSKFKIDDLYSITATPSFIRIADAIESIIDNHQSNAVEDNYLVNRKKYCKSNKTKMKSALKKMYQYCYMIFGVKRIPILASRFAFEEWRDSAENIKKHDVWAQKIDAILEQYYQNHRKMRI